MLPEQHGAIVIPNNNFFANRNGVPPRYIIIHGSAGGRRAQDIAAYFASTEGTLNPVSCHYIIGQDGTLVQCISERDGAWANGLLTKGHDSFWNVSINPNLLTIAIEHCKPSLDNSDALTGPQQLASFVLVHDICQRWGIPMRIADAEGGITGHFSLDPINRSRCPGNYPWEQLWTFLEGKKKKMLDLNDPVVRLFFTDGGNGTWKCKNGVMLQGAILIFYRSNGGPSIFGLPLANEIRLPQYPNTAIVPCERAIIAFDPERKIDAPPIHGPCYLLHIESGVGQQLLLQRSNALIHNLSAKLTQIHALSEI
ncbi:N-acetylmuramoyl-L-alanine amidase [Dictyobacter formicarum]|uniref:N-acetylmuramoyl-L-alanine amidase n=1 Tax=Dictyobacter formicarum TaxID=2778368 RepID=A0ABQ3VJ81_9CHLR|nr:peptidoglycan recognition family protein [Dictyobacter formicarum]GHO86270.1 hypothetical protein KSZ_42760 [Dictyobacter formicarum]